MKAIVAWLLFGLGVFQLLVTHKAVWSAGQPLRASVLGSLFAAGFVEVGLGCFLLGWLT